MIYIGIDPGALGAVAIINEFSQGRSAKVFDCPEFMIDRVRLLKDMAGEYENWYCQHNRVIAMIEKVHAFFKSSAKSAFSFGENFGAWQAILSTIGIPYTEIAPTKWQSVMFDSAKKQKDTKKQSVELASRLYPTVEFTTKRGKLLDGRADALLIATYLEKIHKSKN